MRELVNGIEHIVTPGFNEAHYHFSPKLRAYYGHGFVINGRVWEYAQWNLARLLTAKVSDEEAIKALRRMADEATGYGVTSLQIMPMMPVTRFARLLVKADLPLRLRAIPFSLTNAQGRDRSEIRQAIRAYTFGSARAGGGLCRP